MTWDRVFELAFGVLQLTPSEFWDMTPRQFTAGVTGKLDYDRKMVEAYRDLIFSSSRFNATGIAGALSAKQAKNIKQTRFPWEKGQFEMTERGNINYDDAKALFNMISVNNKDAEA